MPDSKAIAEPSTALSDDERLHVLARRLFAEARQDSAREDAELEDWYRRYRRQTDASVRPGYLDAWMDGDWSSDGSGTE